VLKPLKNRVKSSQQPVRNSDNQKASDRSRQVSLTMHPSFHLCCIYNAHINQEAWLCPRTCLLKSCYLHGRRWRRRAPEKVARRRMDAVCIIKKSCGLGRLTAKASGRGPHALLEVVIRMTTSWRDDGWRSKLAWKVNLPLLWRIPSFLGCRRALHSGGQGT
jgi:hypothetical protein